MTPRPATPFRLRAEARLKNARLVELRERLGLNQAAFAAKVGIYVSTYCGYETLRLYPTEAHAELLADIAGCEVETLFPEALRAVAEKKLPRVAVTTADIEPERLLTAVPRATAALPSPEEPTSALELIERAETLACIHTGLDRLADRDRKMVLRYFGLDGKPAETLEAIGDRYGVRQERVRQIIKRSLRLIERALSLRGLAPHAR